MECKMDVPKIRGEIHGEFQIAPDGRIIDARFAACGVVDGKVLPPAIVVFRKDGVFSGTTKQFKLVLEKEKCTLYNLNATRSGGTGAVRDEGLVAYTTGRTSSVLPEIKSKFGVYVTCMSVLKVKFKSVLELKQTIFEGFPNLTELNFSTCVITDEEDQVMQARASSSSSSERQKPCSGLRKLSMKRDDEDAEELNGRDVFQVWGFEEWFKKFPDLESLEYDGEGCCKFPLKKEFFNALTLAGTKLSSLNYNYNYMSYNVMDCPETIEATRSFLQSCGDKLNHIRGYWGNRVSVLEAFKNFNPKNLKTLSVTDLDLNEFGLAGGVYQGLKHVKICHRYQRSLQFLHRMPNLREVDYHFGFVEKDDQRVGRSSVPCSTVDAITLMNCGALNHCYDVFSAFDNVKKVFIVEERNQVSEWLSGEEGARLESLLPLIGQHWPGVVALNVSGPNGLADADFTVWSRKGNVSEEALRRLLYFLPHLEAFEYSDDFEKLIEAARIEREEEMAYLDDMEDCSDEQFREYAMFQEQISPADKLKRMRVVFGENALNWFSCFNKLRELRLQRACMTERQGEVLRARLSILKVQEEL